MQITPKTLVSLKVIGLLISINIAVHLTIRIVFEKNLITLIFNHNTSNNGIDKETASNLEALQQKNAEAMLALQESSAVNRTRLKDIKEKLATFYYKDQSPALQPPKTASKTPKKSQPSRANKPVQQPLKPTAPPGSQENPIAAPIRRGLL